jgi:membrane associated rhomboid family serine protease
MRSYSNITLWLIGINVVFFLAVAILSLSFGDGVLNYVAFNPADFVSGTHVWTIITSIFMHGSVTHLLVNMLSLMFLGSFVEKLIGSKRYLGIYLISGIIANLFYVLFAYLFGGMNIPAVGASGAIFGVAGMLVILTPKMPVYIMFIPVAMPMWFGVILMLVVMWLLTITINLPIGNAAHLGGLLCGLVYALYLRKKFPHKARMISEHFS